ncbi:MAG: SPOR domain-containing protein [Chromatiales bacterium]|nr:SPOR domain-containing protein [Chromatiales bacterium]
MRTLLLSLVLANLLVLAWQFWVDPSPPTISPAGDGLSLFGAGKDPGTDRNPARPATDEAPDVAAAPLPTGTCFRLGPFPDSNATQQAARRLAGRGIDASPIARDAQLWLGHWVQISGFGSVAAAESARERLRAGGIADALLMQDGPQPMISLGVFRDRNRADRVAATARNLGFEARMTDRYRPGVEYWLFLRPRAGQAPGPGDLSLAGDRIMRTEPASCEEAGSTAAPAGSGSGGTSLDAARPGNAQQTL